MKKSALLILALVLMLATSSAFAATNTYQVTGPVLALTADTITVQKGSEKWEIALNGATLPAGVVVGSKVTITYTMSVNSIVLKPTKK